MEVLFVEIIATDKIDSQVDFRDCETTETERVNQGKWK